MQNVIVLKFGSSVLRSADHLPNVVHEIYRWYREGHGVIAVVSAIGKTTEALIRESRTLTHGKGTASSQIPTSSAASQPRCVAPVLEWPHNCSPK